MSEHSTPAAPVSPYAGLVGREFPGGDYTLTASRAWLIADALGDDPWDPTPHPVLAWMAGVGAMGVTWDELFAWFGATADDGPMFGEHRTTMHRPLTGGATYRVSGRIVSVQRKSGRRAGVFDVVAYELDLHLSDDPAGELVARCHNSIVLPRREK